MDRIAEMYLVKVPSRQFSSNFPLRPFVNHGKGLAYDDPHEYVYTTIGDMAKQTAALNYRYASPAVPDYLPISRLPSQTAAVPRGGTSISLPTTQPLSSNAASQGHKAAPYIVFHSVSCLKHSYRVDVFVSGAESIERDPVHNPDYIGSITRLGMGNGRGEEVGIRNSQRCMKKPVARVLQAEHVKDKLKNGFGVQQLVTEISTDRRLEEEEWKAMPGFEGNIVWS
jgi:hypothetical protein